MSKYNLLKIVRLPNKSLEVTLETGKNTRIRDGHAFMRFHWKAESESGKRAESGTFINK